MTPDAFWEIVGAAREDAEGPDEVAAGVSSILTERSLEEVVAFDQERRRLQAVSYSYALWGAGYLINGGCSDDGFEYFRSWLFTQGREVFERALTDPDSLAEVFLETDEDEAECEEFMGAAMEVYRERTGDYPQVETPAFPELGENWDFDDDAEMTRRYPRLSAAIAARDEELA